MIMCIGPIPIRSRGLTCICTLIDGNRLLAFASSCKLLRQAINFQHHQFLYAIQYEVSDSTGKRDALKLRPRDTTAIAT